MRLLLLLSAIFTALTGALPGRAIANPVSASASLAVTAQRGVRVQVLRPQPAAYAAVPRTVPEAARSAPPVRAVPLYSDRLRE